MLHSFLTTVAVLFGAANAVVNVTNLPITFYKGGLSSVDITVIDYFQVYQCESAPAEYDETKVSIIVPSNVNWDTTQPWVAAEVSRCSDDWSSDGCVFATNYVYSANPTAYGTIIWQHDVNTTFNDSYFYVRFIAPIQPVEYTFEVSYTTGEDAISGSYNFNIFKTTTMTGNYQNVKQYVKSYAQYAVANYGSAYFFVDFCETPEMDNKNKHSKKNSTANDYDITVTVASPPSYPLGAFELVGCPYSYGTTQCTINQEVAVYDKEAASVALIRMTPNDFDLSAGVYVLVYGTGGSTDKQNPFYLSAVVDEQN